MEQYGRVSKMYHLFEVSIVSKKNSITEQALAESHSRLFSGINNIKKKDQKNVSTVKHWFSARCQ